MIEIPVGLQPELVPMYWLIGTWEGTGMVEYAVDGEMRKHPFRQRVTFRHDDLPFLEYQSNVWLLDEETDEASPLTSETGFWRLSRPRDAGDVGPGFLPPTEPPTFNNADAVETLRNDQDGFDLEVSLVHPTGVAEHYYGVIRGPRVDLATDGILSSKNAEDYRAATRMYGLVNGKMFWLWNIKALGQELATHASAELARVEPAAS
ncbi:FABP family protein [Gulosibacter molinativorax]|uniref:Peroxynitrite isomerase n=1 Tax=Gulosibacter molinativorax TaxID=256821 RepID=A0ABT7C3Z8_9MICO|nr:FABP family protein [Gulosibacter molinativorax]MDJ1369962.1 FABP family protein [Gulosibacter molinativorax]QUY63849.1 Fatty acid-binding protein [Gulosibacter molinativorax]